MKKQFTFTNTEVTTLLLESLIKSGEFKTDQDKFGITTIYRPTFGGETEIVLEIGETKNGSPNIYLATS